MATVTCSECHKETEVPFTPTPGKPVYCNDCFRKRRSASPAVGGPRGGSGRPGGSGGSGGRGPPRRFGEPVRPKKYTRSDYPGFENFKQS